MSFKIEYFDYVPFKGSCKLLDDSLTTSTSHKLTFPAAGGEVALKSDIESGGVDLTGYATQEWVNSKNYLTAHQSLTGYATKTGTETLTNKTLDEPILTQRLTMKTDSLDETIISLPSYEDVSGYVLLTSSTHHPPNVRQTHCA